MEIRKRGQSLEFLLTDYGLPACPEKIKPRALDDIRPGGLGCHFIKEVMDEVEYLPLQDKTGNQLRMVKQIS
jgi:sigma-B regulation protein RsbU (phosphoserine phosphatase)